MFVIGEDSVIFFGRKLTAFPILLRICRLYHFLDSSSSVTWDMVAGCKFCNPLNFVL